MMNKKADKTQRLIHGVITDYVLIIVPLTEMTCHPRTPEDSGILTTTGRFLFYNIWKETFGKFKMHCSEFHEWHIHLHTYSPWVLSLQFTGQGGLRNTQVRSGLRSGVPENHRSGPGLRYRSQVTTPVKGFRDFYHNRTNSILQQMKRKFWKIAGALFRIS